MPEPRFKPISVSLEFHEKLTKLSEIKTKELGTKISIPKIVEMMYNKLDGVL